MEENKETKLEIIKEDIIKDPSIGLHDSSTNLNKPTSEEIEQYKNEFQEALKAFENTKWQVSEPGKFGANDVAIFLLEFMEKYAFWSKTEWMGMLKMEDELKKAIAISDEIVGLRFGYQALEFCAYMLANPGGTGIQLAKDFEAQADKYSKIGMKVGASVEVARKKLKDIQYKQERWAAAEQGFYYEREDETETEKPVENPGMKIIPISEEEVKNELEVPKNE
jgi:hypothetical protein